MNILKNEQGFTLPELIFALAGISVVIVVGLGAVACSKFFLNYINP